MEGCLCCHWVVAWTALVSALKTKRGQRLPAHLPGAPTHHQNFGAGGEPYPYLAEIARHIYRKARVARLSGAEAPAAIPANSLSASSCSTLGDLDSSKSAMEASRGEFKHLETRELLHWEQYLQQNLLLQQAETAGANFRLYLRIRDKIKAKSPPATLKSQCFPAYTSQCIHP